MYFITQRYKETDFPDRFIMAHDFERFPELRNNQFEVYYMDSPHKQITEDFVAKVIKVTDGDTIRVEWTERDFDFPVRLRKIAAPELDQVGGRESKVWLSDQILGKEVEILIDPKNRVGKWGRLIGDVISEGRSMSEASLDDRQSTIFGITEDGAIPNEEAWFNGT